MTLFDPRREPHLAHGGTFNANPLSMASGLATLAELTPETYAELEARAVELKAKLERLFASAGLPACVNQIGSLFNIHFTEGPVRSHADVLAADRELLRELHFALLDHGILFTPRGMGCLSTPMTSSEVDAFVDAAQLGARIAHGTAVESPEIEHHSAVDGHDPQDKRGLTTQRKPMWLMPVSIICGRRAAGR